MKWLFIFSLCFPLFVYSQIKTDFNRKYSDSLPESYKLDISTLREHIYAGIPDKIKNDKLGELCYYFADNSAYQISELISKGNIYSDWSELEEYINDILKKVIPKELYADSVIHVYIRKEGDYNAFMTPSGHIFMNIGLLSEVYNESTIAGVLVHELAHYYLKHSIVNFLQQRKGEFVRQVFNDKILNNYSRIHELQADSLAMVWLHNSGYNINGILFSFQTIERLESNYKLKLDNLHKFKATTHPLAEERLMKINEFIEKHKINEGKFFLVNEDKFLKLKEEVKPEILKHLLADYKYADCIEQAFKFHIFDPDNIIYVNYLMESIRRQCYLMCKLWDKNFITDRYFQFTEVKGKAVREEMKDHLFTKFNLDVLHMDVRVAAQIKAKFYWKDLPKFTTNKEAYEFFYRLSLALKDHECILSKALSITDNKSERDSLLKEYLKYTDVKHSNFALNLLNGTVYNKLSKKKLVVFTSLATTVRINKDDVHIRNHCSDTINELLCIFDSVMLGTKDCIPVFLPYLNNSNLNEYIKLKELESFSHVATYSEGVRTELYILDPEFWETFMKYNVQEIEFIFGVYFESRKTDFTIASQKEVMDMSYNSVFSRAGCSHYLEVFISSVRMIKGGTMKVRFYSGTKQLKFKKTGYSEIVRELISQLYNKEHSAGEFDYMYDKYY